ncbi:GatB/YqeY domain-containing protein [bacterium]|nr:GatB/YqeY domain-containing protein [bacterium]
MMIKEQITDHLKDAMRERNQLKINTLRGIIAEIKKIEIDTRKESDDTVTMQVLQKEIKKRKEAVEYAKQGNRQDLLDQYQAEIALVVAYLPEQYSEEKLLAIMQALIGAGANNIGAIMGGLNREHKGKFDAKQASEMAKSLLSK